jgi:hypothetical protein
MVREIMGRQKSRSDSFVVTSRPSSEQASTAGRSATRTVETKDQRVHVTDRASLLRAITAAMKDRPSFGR